MGVAASVAAPFFVQDLLYSPCRWLTRTVPANASMGSRSARTYAVEFQSLSREHGSPIGNRGAQPFRHPANAPTGAPVEVTDSARAMIRKHYPLHFLHDREDKEDL